MTALAWQPCLQPPLPPHPAPSLSHLQLICTRQQVCNHSQSQQKAGQLDYPNRLPAQLCHCLPELSTSVTCNRFAAVMSSVATHCWPPCTALLASVCTPRERDFLALKNVSYFNFSSFFFGATYFFCSIDFIPFWATATSV